MSIFLVSIAAAFLFQKTTSQETVGHSSKRGLIEIATKYPTDQQIWVEPGSDLTWYYNYDNVPSPEYSNLSYSRFEFVPMLFSAPSSTTDTSFLTSVTQMIKEGLNISHVLGFNEPDGTLSTGGSNVDPNLAATTWIRQIAPLQKLGLKAGAPAVTGSEKGFTWLNEFFGNCTEQGTNCTTDFIPVHWYGDFQGLASHLGQVVETYPNTPIWITEYALSYASLAETQSFFNESAEYFDRLSYVERYSYFGSFRSDVSNIGPNAAMLTQKGLLTDIGSWYLGGSATNNIPEANSACKEGVPLIWPMFVIGFAFIFCNL